MARRKSSSLLTRAPHKHLFARFSKIIALLAGHPVAFILAFLLIVSWAIAGPFFGFSNTWQLMINTTTTIATFLMVFLIQSTQNRESTAMQIKIDELIRTQQHAHNALLDLEELTESELEELRALYEQLATKARKNLRAGKKDTKVMEL